MTNQNDDYLQKLREAHPMEKLQVEITQLRGNLSLAEEGLANYALEVQGLQQFKEWAEPQCQDYAANRNEIERLRMALTSIKSMAAGARQTMVASDILETARKALAGATHEPEASHYCIDCNEAHDPRTCGALKSAVQALIVSAEEASHPASFRHWSKDERVPYENCHCRTCVPARAALRT